MSDTHQRSLERAAAAGDPGASVRLLRERVRAGALPRAGLDLAAYLGDSIARRVVEELGSGGGWASVDALEVEAWVRRLEDESREATVRAALAVGRAVLEGWEHESGLKVSGAVDGLLQPEQLIEAGYTSALAQALAPRRALEAAEAWVTCPCPAHAAASEAASLGLCRGPAGACCLAVARSMAVAEFGVQAVFDAHEVFLGEVEDDEAAARVRATIREALVPWALGTRDVVRCQPRLERPELEPTEWAQRGWVLTWTQRGDGIALGVALGAWSVEYELPDADRHAAIVALDERLWRERRWLAPWPGERGYTRTLRVRRDQAAPQAHGTSAR